MAQVNWDGFFDDVDWNAAKAEGADEREKLKEYFDGDGFDYKRSYIREVMQKHPEIMNRYIIDSASEEMFESHLEGVELDIDDALRFVANDKPKSIERLMETLTSAGVTGDNFADVIAGGIAQSEETHTGTRKNKTAKSKARLLTVFADYLGKNPDVLILGLPTFDPEQNWTQAKLAFFSENLSDNEKQTLKNMKGEADRCMWKIKNDVAVAYFKIDNIWDDYS